MTYLEPGEYVDSDAPSVVAFAREACGDVVDDIAKAIRLYYAVRDGIVYTPYCDFKSPQTFRASACLARGSGFCVGKAALLAAAARASGIPARVGFADVINHLATKRLVEMMRTEVFVFHGYDELYLDGRWVKATTAFDAQVCARFGVAPLEFDGLHDAVLQPLNGQGARFMEYVKDHGTFDDFPFEKMVLAWREAYPHMVENATLHGVRGDFAAEAAQP